MGEVSDLVLGQPDVIPGDGLEEIHAPATDNVVPWRPHAEARRDEQDGRESQYVRFSHVFVKSIQLRMIGDSTTADDWGRTPKFALLAIGMISGSVPYHP